MSAAELRQVDVERWLAAEREGREPGAEQAFARVFAAVPRVEPGPAFVGRVAQAAVRARVRRRLVLRGARAAVFAGVAIGGAVLAYLTVVQGGSWVVRTGALLAVQAVSVVVRSAAEGLDWWSIVARVGAATGNALATPQVSSAVLAVEVVGVAALYALSRLLRTDGDTADSREAGT